MMKTKMFLEEYNGLWLFIEIQTDKEKTEK